MLSRTDSSLNHSKVLLAESRASCDNRHAIVSGSLVYNKRSSCRRAGECRICSNVAPSNLTSDPELVRLAETAYDELRRLARGYLNRERVDHTLQPTALVNEAYLRLADQKRTHWNRRAHFLGIAALLMRRVLRNTLAAAAPAAAEEGPRSWSWSMRTL